MVQALATVTYLPTPPTTRASTTRPAAIVTVPILGNDLGLFDTTSAAAACRSGTPMMSMLGRRARAPGACTSSTSTVSFEPLAGFTGDPTPVPYRVADVNGNLVTANVTITYLQPRRSRSPGMSVDAPLWGSIAAILMGLVVVLFTRLRRVARHRM